MIRSKKIRNNSIDLKEADIVFSDNLEEAISDKFSEYTIHFLCYKGYCTFRMAEKDFMVKEGDFVIWTHGKLVSDVYVSNDFQVTVLYLTYHFSRRNAPNNNYEMKGHMSLLQNPVMHLTENEKLICDNDLRQIKNRLNNPHHFYEEIMGCAVMTLVLDLYDIHARINEENPVSERNAFLLKNFMELLETDEYKTYREVAHYASKLNVTSKYLSEVCKKVSGHPATFWIDRFTITEIVRLLRNKELSLTEISDELNFTSLSYFSRYVQRILGVPPTEYRQRLDKDSI